MWRLKIKSDDSCDGGRIYIGIGDDCSICGVGDGVMLREANAIRDTRISPRM